MQDTTDQLKDLWILTDRQLKRARLRKLATTTGWSVAAVTLLIAMLHLFLIEVKFPMVLLASACVLTIVYIYGLLSWRANEQEAADALDRWFGAENLMSAAREVLARDFQTVASAHILQQAREVSRDWNERVRQRPLPTLRFPASGAFFVFLVACMLLQLPGAQGERSRSLAERSETGNDIASEGYPESGSTSNRSLQPLTGAQDNSEGAEMIQVEETSIKPIDGELADNADEVLWRPLQREQISREPGMGEGIAEFNQKAGADSGTSHGEAAAPRGDPANLYQQPFNPQQRAIIEAYNARRDSLP